jgi:hypothetical protein
MLELQAQTCVHLYAKCSLMLFDFNENKNVLTNFIENPFSGS